MSSQVEAARRILARLAGDPGYQAYEGLIREILVKWPRVSAAIETAMANHGYTLLTIQVYRGEKAARFKYERTESGEWALAGVDIGKRVMWGFRWEYDLARDQLIEKRKRILARPASP